MKILERITKFLNWFCVEISGWVALILTLLVSLDVILRYLLKLSIPGGVEITQVLLVLMIYLVLGGVQEKKEHIRIDFFIDKIPINAKRYWELIVLFVALIFLSIVLVYSVESFRSSWEMKEHYGGAIRVPIYPARATIVIGIAVILLVLVKDMLLLLTSRGKDVIVKSPEQKEIEEAIAKLEKK